MESEMELEQDYERHEKAVVEICEPENIVAEDVEFETSIDSIDYTLCNLDISVAVVATESGAVDA